MKLQMLIMNPSERSYCLYCFCMATGKMWTDKKFYFVIKLDIIAFK